MIGTDASAGRAGALPRPARRSVRPSTPEDAAGIITLMDEAGLSSNTEPRHLHWKYWQERPEWSGSRSYVLADGSALLAHGAVIPATCVTMSGRLRMAHMIDWAARPGEVGVGVALLKNVGKLTEALYAIGGSAATMRILPQIGFRSVGTVGGYVRPLSPLRLWHEAEGRNWRLAARMARSVFWKLTAPRPSLRGWSARPLPAEEVGRIAQVMPRPRRDLAVLERGEDLFRYLLTCPIVTMKLYALECDGRTRGYFLLSLMPAQVRLADAWVDSEERSDWRALAGCAVREASRHGGAAELAAWASDPLLAQALSDNGFHLRYSLPIMLRPGAQGMPDAAPRMQMLDNDAHYLHQGRGQLWA